MGHPGPAYQAYSRCSPASLQRGGLEGRSSFSVSVCRCSGAGSPKVLGQSPRMDREGVAPEFGAETVGEAGASFWGGSRP